MISCMTPNKMYQLYSVTGTEQQSLKLFLERNANNVFKGAKYALCVNDVLKNYLQFAAVETWVVGLSVVLIT